MGRPIKYLTEEDRKAALIKSKTNYMLNKPWVCTTCGNRDYSLAGKWSHIKTRKHIFNTILKALEDDDDINLISNN